MILFDITFYDYLHLQRIFKICFMWLLFVLLMFFKSVKGRDSSIN